MELICLLCHDGVTDDEGLIKLHENIDHHGHLSCLSTYYEIFQSIDCPLCGKRLAGGAENLLEFDLFLYNASNMNRLDLFARRLEKLAIGDYHYERTQPEIQQRPERSEEWNNVLYWYELWQGLLYTTTRKQVNFLQPLLNHVCKTNIKLELVFCYRKALMNDARNCASMILEAVLKNQTAFSVNDLYELLTVAISHREMESISLILQKGIGVEFRKRVILKLGGILECIDFDNDLQYFEPIGQWPLEELDYGLRFAARDGFLKCCKFLISKGASIRRAGVGSILLKTCVDKNDQDCLQYVSHCFESNIVEAAKYRKGKWAERLKLQVLLKMFSLRLKVCHKPYGY